MLRNLIATLCMTLLSAGAHAEVRLDVHTVHDANDEKATAAQLERLVKQYDLKKWILTTQISIDNQEIPHSHPVLTLHARHIKDDELLLSTFIHEQLHWFLGQHEKQTSEAVAELRKIFPLIPVGFPEGASDETSNYEHLLVCYLEMQADRELLGELKARQIMQFWSTDHYTWIYKAVLENPGKIGGIIRSLDLMPH